MTSEADRRDHRAMKRILACLALLWAGPAAAQTQLIVPFDAGSSTDVVARAMQPTLSAKLGQSVIVLNKPGASGTIGAAEVARAKPDGSTIGILGMAGIAMVPHFRKLSFDLDSFDFVCQLYSAPVIVMVAPDSPHKDIKALLEFGKANPGKLFYGSPGIGTPDHINMANFLRQNGVQGTHVPFGGGGAVVQAINSNQIVAVSNTTVLLNAYKLKPLATLTAKRLPELPDVPAAAEIGPPVEAAIWATLAAPKGLPAATRVSLEKACEGTLEDPAYRAIALRAGFPPYFRGGDAFRTFVGEEFKRFGVQMKAEGLELQ
jgi:tripartite-type tricarboxylate transporter receptor subunit TctC